MLWAWTLLVVLLHPQDASAAPRVYKPEFSYYVADLPPAWHTAFDQNLEMHFGSLALGRMASYMVSEDSGFWLSHWTKFYPMFLQRVLYSPLRTYNMHDADAIFVPTCLGYCHNSTVTPLPMDTYHDIAFFGNASLLFPLLGQKPHFMIYNGVPPRHWYKPLRGWRETLWSHFTLIALQNDGVPNVVAAPYPSHEHFSVASKTFHRTSNQSSLPPRPREYRVAASFRSRNATTDKARLRQILLHQCTQRPQLCRARDWYQEDTADVQASTYALYFNSSFTMHPPGDWLLRGAFYDSIVATCLPIVFVRNYTAYAAFADIISYDQFVTFINPLSLRHQNVVDIIANLVPDYKATVLLTNLYKIRHVFQYMLYPQHRLIRLDTRDKRMALDDAFTFTMKALLRNLCNRAILPDARCHRPEADGPGVSASQSTVHL